MRLFLPLLLVVASAAPAQTLNSRDVAAVVFDGGYVNFVMPDMMIITASNPTLGLNGEIDLSNGYSACKSGGSMGGVWILPRVATERPDWETTWIDKWGNNHTVSTYLTDRERRSQILIQRAAERHQFQVIILQRYFPARPPPHR